MAKKLKQSLEIVCADGYKRYYNLFKGIYSCSDCGMFVGTSLDTHTCKSAILNKDKLFDRWGEYFNFTGHESVETCFWCGSQTKKRYCTENCRKNYLRSYNWLFASAYCLERYGNKCSDCGGEPKAWMEGIWGIGGDVSQQDTRLEVHHIDPTRGEYRTWSKKNVPENLVCLCHKCHKERHRSILQKHELAHKSILELF